MSTYRVLCVGGPLDGKWRTVDRRSFEAAEPPKFSFSTADTDTVIEPFIRYRYDVEAIALFGSQMHLAFCHDQLSSSTERDKAAMRAVLQRDVVAHLGGE